MSFQRLSKRILVVDDHPDIRRGLAILIHRLGHQSILASCVREGLEKLRLEPTHIILDLNLHDGNGTTILQYVRQKQLPAQIAVVSGTIDDDLIAVAKGLKPDAFIRKTNWEAVVDWIEQ